jgi:dTDP-4-dehydrorhamnose 3,5-epimerase-like enzyme
MKIIKPYFKFEDERGSIKGIINKGNWEEINYIFSKKNFKRAEHFHKKTDELFIIIDGLIRITYFPIDDLKKIKEKTVKSGDVFMLKRGIYHEFEILKDSYWFNVLSKKMNPKNPDIHSFNESKI